VSETEQPPVEELRPYTLVAELTYRCPLRCAYCSNPVELERHGRELDTATWRRVLGEAEALGVVQLHLSGGEPLLRDDLEALIEEAHARQLYTNLITSGTPLTFERLRGLAERGLDAVQISFQDARPGAAARIAGREVFAAKEQAAAWTRALRLPLTINVVLQRDNIGRVDEIVALAERLGAERLELANTQFLGWALANRAALLPDRTAMENAREVADSARQRLRGRMEVLFVLPDYHRDLPRACMDGWARRYIVIAPDGLMLPCHAAHTITTLHFENVRDHSMDELWHESAAFRAFRGEDWMQAPCRTCDRRTVDFGGCRCQAFHLTGAAAATDPACALSPRHDIVERARLHALTPAADPAPLIYRRVPIVP
jgi:pyrroloquinoline quinone biosynthesis protein E